MYLAAVLNERRLFQHVGGWMPALKARGAGKRVQVILRRAHQVLFHLQQAEAIASVALAQFSAHSGRLVPCPQSLHGWSPLVETIVIELSGALGALRVLQNECWQLLAAAFGARNAPSSMRDAYKTLAKPSTSGQKRAKWVSEIPVHVRHGVLSYWRSSGELIADYRDVDQHHDLLARGCTLVAIEGHLHRVVIQLPDNPASASPAHFTYTKSIDGIALASQGFQALHDLLDEVSKSQGAPARPLDASIDFVPAIQHEPGAVRPTALLLFDTAGRSGMVLGQDAEMHAIVTPFGLNPRDDDA